MSATVVPRLLTAGKIAAELKSPIHRVLYVLATREHIRPVARAGNIRLYDRAGLDAVRQELNAIAAERLLRGASA